jgi:hypothetical protein
MNLFWMPMVSIYGFSKLEQLLRLFLFSYLILLLKVEVVRNAQRLEEDDAKRPLSENSSVHVYP